MAKIIQFPKAINAPVERIHYCPICNHPYLEDPVVSIIVDGLEVCPDCAYQEKDIFPYLINYMRFLSA